MSEKSRLSAIWDHLEREARARAPRDLSVVAHDFGATPDAAEAPENETSAATVRHVAAWTPRPRPDPAPMARLRFPELVDHGDPDREREIRATAGKLGCPFHGDDGYVLTSWVHRPLPADPEPVTVTVSVGVNVNVSVNVSMEADLEAGTLLVSSCFEEDGHVVSRSAPIHAVAGEVEGRTGPDVEDLVDAIQTLLLPLPRIQPSACRILARVYAPFVCAVVRHALAAELATLLHPEKRPVPDHPLYSAEVDPVAGF